jgi:osmotically inducible protein OsmC
MTTSIYTTCATSTGGRNGHVTSDNHLIDADVRLPKALGGKDDGHLTPETFFAAGYAACFDNAVMHIIRLEKIKSAPPVVTAKVELLQSEPVFSPWQ